MKERKGKGEGEGRGKVTYITSGPEVVSDLGDANKVGHMGFAGGGCSPVNADTAFLQNFIQLVFTKDLLSRARHKPCGLDTDIDCCAVSMCNASLIPGQVAWE